MTCNQCQPELSAYLDGELPAALRAAVEAHLAACPVCQQRLHELRRVTAGIRALPQQSPPPEFLRDIRAKLGRPERRRNWWPVPIGAVAVVAALFAATVLLRPPATKPTGDSQEREESAIAPLPATSAESAAPAAPPRLPAARARSFQDEAPPLQNLSTVANDQPTNASNEFDRVDLEIQIAPAEGQAEGK